MPKHATDDPTSIAETPSERSAQMHTQSEKTGGYSAEELQKFLGDPRQGVSVPVTGAFPQSAVVAHKK